MRRFFFFFISLVGLSVFALSTPGQAAQHVWYLTSPNHGQTFSFGSEQSRVWKMVAPGNHLAAYTTWTNEPFADGGNRRSDYFTFNFPKVTLGSDGETFFYHAQKNLALPVAARRRDFFGIYEIKLLPTSYLEVRKVHGYLTFTLVIGDRPFEKNPHTEIGILH